MHILPVIDIWQGTVVHAQQGDRSTYRPLDSWLCPEGRPLALTENLYQQYRFSSAYVADLNAIERQAPHVEILVHLLKQPMRLLWDGGFQHEKDVLRLLEQVGMIPASMDWVFGSESVQGVSALEKIVAHIPPQHCWFSFDWQADRLKGSKCWSGVSLETIIKKIEALGIHQFIWLNLSAVGVTGQMAAQPHFTINKAKSLNLLSELIHSHPKANFYYGGGIQDEGELEELQLAGLTGVLLSTSLHQRRLLPLQVRDGNWTPNNR